MEVVKQVPTLDFNSGGSGCSTPYISAPSSPKRFVDFYFSAPTSPTHASAIYSDFNGGGTGGGGGSSSSSIIPFDWEETPGTPKSKDTHNSNKEEEEDDDDFAFDFSGQLEMKPSLSSADELFAHGKIRPLKPPPRLQISKNRFDDESSSSSTPPAQKSSLVSSPRSPIKQGKKIFREAFSSPKQRNIDVDPFAVAIEQTRKGTELERGRERTPVSSSSSNTGVRSRGGSRSLSPFRVFEWKEEHQQQQHSTKPTTSSSSSSTKPIFRKWRLKDFLLFRSASEGRATDKDPLRKFAVLSKTMSNEDVKTSSFRSTDSSGSVSSSSKRRVPVSPHELHYTVNRAVSEELKKKTLLPYKQGLFGCLGFNPTVQGIAKGFNL